MPQPPHTGCVSRRTFLFLGVSLPAPILLAACSTLARREPVPSPSLQPTAAAGISPDVSPSVPPPPRLDPTPACGDQDDPTPPQTAGPFYTPNSPERTSLLEAGMAGTTITLSGQVLTVDCAPVPGALVDFWHADNAGVYDNQGFRLRGHQFTDAEGRYTLETIVPGLYPGRTRHFHVNVQAPDRPILTTQLYFPDEPANAGDGLFDEALLMSVADSEAARTARFNFVLDIA